MIRRHKLNTCHNMRDIGGYQGIPYITKYNEFIRSDDISQCSSEEIDYIRNIGVKTVIDLRGSKEASMYPNIFNNSEGFKYFNIPLMRENRYSDIFQPFALEDYYIEVIENKEAICNLFTTIANNAEGAVLYHCTAGKDRTGITTCLLLMLAGVDKYDIAADYEVTFTYLTEKRKEFEVKYPQMPQHIHKSNPELILDAYMYIINKYSSANDYLLQADVSQENINKIRSKLCTN